MLAHVALVLTLILGIAAVISLFTSIAFPDPDGRSASGGRPSSRDRRGVRVALWLARRPRFSVGAWLTVLTIDALPHAASAACSPTARGGARARVRGPRSCAPRSSCAARGTDRRVPVVGDVGTIVLHLLIRDVSWSDPRSSIGIMLAVTVLDGRGGHHPRAGPRAGRAPAGDGAGRRRPHARELELARRVQLAMLPDELPTVAGLDLAAFSEPAYEASGDFYDVFAVDVPDGPSRTSLGLVVCDVAGKGVASALVMSATRAALRAAAERTPSPAAVLAKVNDTLAMSVPAGTVRHDLLRRVRPGARGRSATRAPATHTRCTGRGARDRGASWRATACRSG